MNSLADFMTALAESRGKSGGKLLFKMLYQSQWETCPDDVNLLGKYVNTFIIKKTDFCKASEEVFYRHVAEVK